MKHEYAEQKDYDCGSKKIPKLRLSQAFIPDQIYREILPLDIAFRKGTLFKELVRPYKPER